MHTSNLLPPQFSLIIDFYCRPLPVQISWKSPSLHEVRAEEHEPALMLRQDAISVFGGGKLGKTLDTDFDCALLPVDNTCRQWLREPSFALALGLVWKYPALVIAVFDCALPSQSEGFTIQQQHQEQQLEIRTKHWSTTVHEVPLYSRPTCYLALISNLILSQVLHFTCILSSIHTHASPPNSAPVEVGILQTLGPAKGYI